MSGSSDNDDIAILPPATRDRKGRLLPGQRSINPHGRPPAIKDIKDAAKAHTRAALNTLISVMNNMDAPAASRVTAAEAILNRGWGRPQQNVEARIDITDMGTTAANVLMELTRAAKEAKQAGQIIDITPTKAAAN